MYLLQIAYAENVIPGQIDTEFYSSIENETLALIINSPTNTIYSSSTILVNITIIGDITNVSYSISNPSEYSHPVNIELANGCYTLKARGYHNTEIIESEVSFCVNESSITPPTPSREEKNCRTQKLGDLQDIPICSDFKCKNNILVRTCSFQDSSYTEKSGVCGLVISPEKNQSSLVNQETSIYLILIVLLSILIIILILTIIFLKR